MISLYDYIKLFNNVYHNYYSKNKNEYNVIIERKPIGIIMERFLHNENSYVRVEGANQDLIKLIRIGDVIIEINHMNVINRTFSEIKNILKNAKEPIVLRIRNLSKYQEFVEKFSKSKKKPTMFSVALKQTMLRELTIKHRNKLIIQKYIGRYLKVKKNKEINKNNYNTCILDLLQHTLTFYQKRTMIEEYFDSYQQNFAQHYKMQYVSHNHDNDEVSASSSISYTIPTLPELPNNVIYNEVMLKIFNVGIMVKIYNSAGYSINIYNQLKSRFVNTSKLTFEKQKNQFQWKYFGNNSTIYCLNRDEITNIWIDVARLNARITVAKNNNKVLIVEFDNKFDILLFNQIIKIIK